MTEAAEYERTVRRASVAEGATLAKFFRGLGDPLRVRIVQLLLEHRELTVNQIAEHLDAAQPKVSHHIACLRWCGYVFTRMEGRTSFNSVRDPRVVQVLALALDFARENDNYIAECERITNDDSRGDGTL